jgi:glycosyltransferase 2 family protein
MKKARILFLIVGIALLAALFAVFGIKKPVMQIIDFGWKFWLCVLIYVFIHLALSFAWMILIPKKLRAKDFLNIFFARIAGDSTTTINSAASVAGDALKALYLQDIVPFKTGLASVVLDRTIHTIGNTLLFLTGIVLAFFKLNLPLWSLAIMFLLFTLLLGILVYLMKHHSRGIIRFVIKKLPRFIHTRILTPERDKKIRYIDSEISSIFTRRKNLRHIYLAIVLHTIPVMIAGTLEIYIIMYFVGGSVTIQDALFTYLFGLFISSIAFFVPLNIGTSEGSYAIALKFLGYDPVTGITVGILRRLRSFVWSGIGLLLLFHKGLAGAKKLPSKKS